MSSCETYHYDNTLDALDGRSRNADLYLFSHAPFTMSDSPVLLLPLLYRHIPLFIATGWCFPNNTQNSGANCAVRAKTDLGSSNGYPPSIPSTGYEGGEGLVSGDPTKTAFWDWAVVYAKYCDGGSMTGAGSDPLRGLWYRGKYNLDAVLGTLVAEQSLSSYKESRGALLHIIAATCICLWYSSC